MNNLELEKYKKAYRSFESQLRKKKLQYYKEHGRVSYIDSSSYSVGDEVVSESGFIGVVVKSGDDINILWQDGEFHYEINDIEKTGKHYSGMEDILNGLNRIERV